MIRADFNSIQELQRAFPTEQSCVDHLELLRWGGNVVSPFDPLSKVYNCKGNRYKCKNTGKYFNVKTNTLFENTKISLQTWFLAIWLVTNHTKGISSMQLAKDLGLTQKTAWFLLHRIRRCYGIENDGELEGEVEIDESFSGGKAVNKHRSRKKAKARNASNENPHKKTIFLGMVEREGRIILKKLAKRNADSILPIIEKHVKSGSSIYTDELTLYRRLNRLYDHSNIKHRLGEYVRGTVSTNSIEGFFGLFKRGLIGVYHFTSEKHFEQYLNEFAFRHNTRSLTRAERINVFLSNTEQRLTYKALISEDPDKYSRLFSQSQL